MVEKPQKGKCAKCGSENIKFYDDGFGRCMDCGRTFQWMEEEETQPQQSQQKQQPQQKQQTQQPQQTSQPAGQQSAKRTPPEPTQQPKKSTETTQRTQQPRQSRTTTQRSQPSQQRSTSTQTRSRSSEKKSKTKSKSSKKSEPSKDFLYITTIGFVLMIIGYILMSVTMMGFDIQPDTVKLLSGLFSLFSHTGILLVGLGLVYGAVTADNLDEKIRSWMLLAMAILLGLFLSFNFVFSSIASIGGI